MFLCTMGTISRNKNNKYDNSPHTKTNIITYVADIYSHKFVYAKPASTLRAIRDWCGRHALFNGNRKRTKFRNEQVVPTIARTSHTAAAAAAVADVATAAANAAAGAVAAAVTAAAAA